jgi:hypothetical protein
MQDIVVLLIGIATFGFVSWKIYKSIAAKPGIAGKCSGCTGCSLKERAECPDK